MKTVSTTRGSPLVALSLKMEETSMWNARIKNACILLRIHYGHCIESLRDLLIIQSLYPDNFDEFFGPQSRFEIIQFCTSFGIPIYNDCSIPHTWTSLFLFQKIIFN